MSDRIRLRTDHELRELINSFTIELNFDPLDDLMISPGAWQHITTAGIEPRLVFAHPSLLEAYPHASQYYRGIALLSQKRVADLVVPVSTWEDGSRKAPIPAQQLLEVAQLYNTIISSIIEGSTNWTLQNGYRNIIANVGIALDGTMRNIIGRDAENRVKNRIKEWLDSKQLILERNEAETEFTLTRGYLMKFGSEPDIEFQQTVGNELRTTATIEIKGGKDRAGALERLGAMQKSFEATPPGCVNFLVAGVVTQQMQARLNQMGVIKVFMLDSLDYDEGEWSKFMNELFHYTIRITDATV